MKIFLLLSFAFVAVSCQKTNFDGFSVFRLYPKSEEHRELLGNLQKDSNYDFWTDLNRVELPVDIMVNPTKQSDFLMNMRQAGLNPEIFIEDIQKLIDQENSGRLLPGSKMSWSQYYNLNDIYTWLDERATLNPGVASVVIGGSTYEGRQIKGLKIAFKPGQRVIYLEGGIHAREWISPATLTYIINELLTSQDPTIRKIAESFEWHIFPSTNPDGYVYTHTSNRMWRKTRKPYGICYGADPNRNWNAHWLEQGSSSNPCADTYAGSAAFSEIETSSISNYISQLASRMDVYLSFHSYSQLMLLPYGHTTQHLDNYNEMIQIVRKSADALSQRYGTRYTVGNIAETIYPASGGSIDWVKQEFKTPVVVAYELRDTGRYGFLLPANQIIPNCLEVMDSLIVMLQEAEKFGYVTIG